MPAPQANNNLIISQPQSAGSNMAINQAQPNQNLVLSHPVDNVKLDDELRDIQGFHAIEIPDWIWITLIVIAVAALGYLIYIKFIRKSEEDTLSISEMTIQKLQGLDLATSSKDFYLSYSEMIRFYLEERLSMPALEKTAEEMKQLLVREHKIQTSYAMFLSKIFARADLAKFAKYEVPIDTKSKDVEVTVQIVKSIEDAILIEEKRKEEAKLRQLEEVEEAKEEAIIQ